MWQKTLIGLVIVIFLLTSCSSSQTYVAQAIQPEQKVKNIILLIGDGMGLAQISAASYSSKKPLALESFPVVGLHKSHSADELVTDSAAGATAFACGIKTYNGAIGVTLDTTPVKTILEEAEENGLSTGLIATSTITHATPASFIAHQFNRVLHEQIATDFLNTDIDYFVGGGKKYFDRRSADERDLSQELVNKGYKVSSFLDGELEDIELDLSKNFAHFVADKHPLPVAAGRTYLSFATRQALRFLEAKSEKGFFIMIEGSQIDWGGHSNDGEYAISEVLDFDRAVAEALKFAESRGNTLVIVTADHECGGLSITNKSKLGRIRYDFTTIGHTASLVPVFAFGPGAEAFRGIYENKAIHTKMRRALGWAEPAITENRE